MLVRSPEGFQLTFGLADGQDVVVGRDSDLCQVRLPHPDVSRRHCRIKNEAGRIVVQDLGTRNGTIINGKRVAEAELSPGDVIEIVGYAISISEPSPERTEPAP